MIKSFQRILNYQQRNQYSTAFAIDMKLVWWVELVDAGSNIWLLFLGPSAPLVYVFYTGDLGKDWASSV